MIDWNAILKVVAGVLASFGGGWATAILSGTTGTKATASGIVSAATYYLGQRQEKVDFKKE